MKMMKTKTSSKIALNEFSTKDRIEEKQTPDDPLLVPNTPNTRNTPSDEDNEENEDNEAIENSDNEAMENSDNEVVEIETEDNEMKKKNLANEIVNEDDVDLHRHQKINAKSSYDGKETWIDDGIHEKYVKRIKEFENQKLIRKERRGADEEEIMDEDGKVRNSDDELFAFYENEDDEDILLTESGFKVPSYIYANLFDYQRTCITWLWELHQQNAGGIIGDEMGLGKTIQVVSFLGALYCQKIISTTLIVCPTSVLLNWVREFHKWYPPIRVVLLHSSGTALTCMTREEVVQMVIQRGGVLITTYEAVRQHQSLFLEYKWNYVILDEGHRIRNPDAEITLVCKQFHTPHRLILTGAPIQNRLRELWSLFDFVFPGRLGTLPTFEDEFVLPIRTGGYAKASRMQIIMAYKCALTLRDLINPYLLRRLKSELKEITKLPKKTEQVIFCKLTDVQRSVYLNYLQCPELEDILKHKVMPFRAIGVLRKICNHPDILMNEDPSETPLEDSWSKSGKLVVVNQILPIWKKQGHRVLLFAQTRQVLNILERFVSETKGYVYCRIDGTTPAKNRQLLIDRFNRDESVFIFLLTTRAGGIGINLMGADRVMLFDPDWNPSTDIQARERAWRLGQKRPVTIYRLITSGTIEEKIYHRQIYKQYLTNKILKDPKQRRCFNETRLRDLFTLNDQQQGTETGDIFVAGQVNRPTSRHHRQPPPSASSSSSSSSSSSHHHHHRESEDLELESSLSNVARVEACTFKVNLPDQEEDGEEGSRDEEPNESVGGDEDNSSIMQKLFDGADIQSMFSHDALESEGYHTQETVLMEMESEKNAKEAVTKLLRSRSAVQRNRDGIHEPTWTGKSGTAGFPKRFGSKVVGGSNKQTKLNNGIKIKNDEGSFFGSKISGFSTGNGRLSSSDLLQKMKQRQMASNPVVKQFNGNVIPKFKSLDVIAVELHDHLKKNEKKGTSTEDILSKFAQVVATKDKNAFRTVLRDIAYLAGGVWKLKEPKQMIKKNNSMDRKRNK